MKKTATKSNENKNRVEFLVYKQVTECSELLKKASEILNDTGDTESTTLDNAMSHLKSAVDMVELSLFQFREQGIWKSTHD